MWGLSPCGFGFGWLFVILGWTALLVVVIWAVLRMFPAAVAPRSQAAQTQKKANDSEQRPRQHETPKSAP